MLRIFLAGTVLAWLGTTSALAHVTLRTPAAAAGSTYTAVLVLPHGCAGKATVSVKVRIPDGVIDVKAQPKAGWNLATATAPYARSYALFGSPVTEGVTEITWSGGDLPDGTVDEFIFSGTLAGAIAGTTMYFPVVQTCTSGEEAWIEIPIEGQPEPELPAPGLKIVEATH